MSHNRPIASEPDDVDLLAFRCPDCEKRSRYRFAIRDHYREVHGNDPTIDVAEPEPIHLEELDRLLEALYVLNKRARRYADQAAQQYRHANGAAARRNSLRKGALYDLKTALLELLANADTIDRVQRHVIDDREYYCCTVRGWSFHVPVDHWHGQDLALEYPADQADADEDGEAIHRELTDFRKDGEAVDSDLSLKDALLCVQSLAGLSANDFLAETYVRYGDGSDCFAGWQYLD